MVVKCTCLQISPLLGVGGTGGPRQSEEVLEPVADVDVDGEEGDEHGRVRVGRGRPREHRDDEEVEGLGAQQLRAREG